MTHPLHRVMSFFALFCFVATFSFPFVAEARVKKSKQRSRTSLRVARDADEKQFSHPVSRCLTKEMIALHGRAEKQLRIDSAKAGANHEVAVKRYQEQFDLIWSAMSEPYCGYGSRGVRAVKKSFVKSLERARVEFLKSIKKK